MGKLRREIEFFAGRRSGFRHLLYMIAGEVTGVRTRRGNVEAELARLLAERLGVATKLHQLCRRFGLPTDWTDREDLVVVLAKMLERVGEKPKPSAPGLSLRERMALLGELEGYPGAVWLNEVYQEIEAWEADQARAGSAP